MASASPAQATAARRGPSRPIRLSTRRGMARSFLFGMIRPGFVCGTVALRQELERGRFDAHCVQHRRSLAVHCMTNPILPHDFPCRSDLESSPGVGLGDEYITIRQRLDRTAIVAVENAFFVTGEHPRFGAALGLQQYHER